MKPSHAIALVLIPLLTVAAAVAASWFRRARDIFFFLMVSLAVLVERLDVNFFSEAWYRGTTRGIQISLIEILAFGLLIGCWMGHRGENRRWFWPGSLGLMLLFFCYAGLSVIISEPRIFGVFELSRMFAAIVIFLATAAYVRSRREWTLLVVALACAVILESAWGLKQHFITQIGRAVGSLTHANSLSMYYCLTVPLLVAVACAGWSRLLRWFCAGAAVLGTVGVLMTLSRAGIPVFAVVVTGTILTCVSWRLTVGRLALRFAIVLGALALVAGFWGQIVNRYEEVSLEEEYFDPTVDGRGVYLRLGGMIVQEHFFGVGLNNWSYYVSRTYGPRIGYRFADYDYLAAVYGTEDDKLVWQFLPRCAGAQSRGPHLGRARRARPGDFHAALVALVWNGGRVPAALARPADANRCRWHFLWDVRPFWAEHHRMGLSADADSLHLSYPPRRPRQSCRQSSLGPNRKECGRQRPRTGAAGTRRKPGCRRGLTHACRPPAAQI